MTTSPRTDLLTTTEMYHLDQACTLIRRAFGHPCYLVGSAGVGGADRYRDVDVRLMLDDEEFAAACPTRLRWEVLCVAISGYLSDRTGLPVDFQIQRTREANERYDGPRNPLGMGRIFAGGGDGTPEWDDADGRQRAAGGSGGSTSFQGAEVTVVAPGGSGSGGAGGGAAGSDVVVTAGDTYTRVIPPRLLGPRAA